MSSADLTQSLNTALFAREKLGWQPDPIQKKILKLRARRVLLNCTRQWGKSTMAAVKAVHRACFEPGSLTVVLSCWRGMASLEKARRAVEGVNAGPAVVMSSAV